MCSHQMMVTVEVEINVLNVWSATEKTEMCQIMRDFEKAIVKWPKIPYQLCKQMSNA
jgi:hypothetical protein